MEEQVNKLIEKIENDTLLNYDFNEVLDMLKDLLISNKEFYCDGYSIHNCEFQCNICKSLHNI